MEVRLLGCHGLGVGLSRALRLAEFPSAASPSVKQLGGAVRVYWTWLTGGSRGLACAEN